jgi:hypothetical protein
MRARAAICTRMSNVIPMLLASCINALVFVWAATASAAAPNAETTSTVVPDGKASSSDRLAGALDFPNRLKRIGDDFTSLRWTDPTVDFRKYDKIRIDDIRVQPDSHTPPLDAKNLKLLNDYFRQSLVRSLRPAYDVVETSGPGVLRLRITIIDVLATRPPPDGAEQAKPGATPPDAVSEPVGDGAPYLGHSLITVQFIDDTRHAVVAEYLETRIGRKYIFGKRSTAGPVTNYVETFSTWDYAKKAFDGWSQQFRKRLDELRAG